jgi:hypothetical protein
MKVACTMAVAARWRRRFQRDDSGVSEAVIALRDAELCTPALRQDVLDHVAGNVSQTEVATLVAVGEPLMIDPQ